MVCMMAWHSSMPAKNPKIIHRSPPPRPSKKKPKTIVTTSMMGYLMTGRLTRKARAFAADSEGRFW